jgi:hypothetical protein
VKTILKNTTTAIMSNQDDNESQLLANFKNVISKASVGDIKNLLYTAGMLEGDEDDSAIDNARNAEAKKKVAAEIYMRLTRRREKQSTSMLARPLTLLDTTRPNEAPALHIPDMATEGAARLSEPPPSLLGNIFHRVNSWVSNPPNGQDGTPLLNQPEATFNSAPLNATPASFQPVELQQRTEAAVAQPAYSASAPVREQGAPSIQQQHNHPMALQPPVAGQTGQPYQPQDPQQALLLQLAQLEQRLMDQIRERTSYNGGPHNSTGVTRDDNQRYPSPVPDKLEVNNSSEFRTEYHDVLRDGTIGSGLKDGEKNRFNSKSTKDCFITLLEIGRIAEHAAKADLSREQANHIFKFILDYTIFRMKAMLIIERIGLRVANQWEGSTTSSNALDINTADVSRAKKEVKNEERDQALWLLAKNSTHNYDHSSQLNNGYNSNNYNGSNNTRGQKRYRPPSFTCDHCGKPGHSAANCRSKKQKTNPSNNSNYKPGGGSSSSST